MNQILESACHLRFLCGYCLGVFVLLLSTVAAEDRAVVTTGSEPASQRTLTGEVVDFNGKELTFRVAAGQVVNVPTQRVLELTSTWNEATLEADQLAAEHKYEQAIAAYRRAVTEEQRPWARRRIFAGWSQSQCCAGGTAEVVIEHRSTYRAPGRCAALASEYCQRGETRARSLERADRADAGRAAFGALLGVGERLCCSGNTRSPAGRRRPSGSGLELFASPDPLS
jgi:hypothetical protein